MMVRKTSEAKPFRPTMQQFDDDPANLNVDTAMDGSRAARQDMPLMMADRLDMIQRNYINNTVNMS